MNGEPETNPARFVEIPRLRVCHMRRHGPINVGARKYGKRSRISTRRCKCLMGSLLDISPRSGRWVRIPAVTVVSDGNVLFTLRQLEMSDDLLQVEGRSGQILAGFGGMLCARGRVFDQSRDLFEVMVNFFRGAGLLRSGGRDMGDHLAYLPGGMDVVADGGAVGGDICGGLFDA